ncbi:MAG: porin, partial [Pirellula sp.]
MRSRELFLVTMMTLSCCHTLLAQEVYFSMPSEPPSQYVFAPSNETTFTLDELSARLQALEAKENTTAAELKKLEDAKKPVPEKPKFPNVAIGGVFQADAVSFSQLDSSRQAYGSIENGADFRRARLGAKGAVSDRMDYFMQMDFGFFGRPTFTDVWTDFKDVGPLGTVRVGQWKQPFGLEVVSSFRYTTFMERSSTFQAFTPFRHIGVGFYNHTDNLDWTWAASYFRTGQDQFGGSLSTDGGNGAAGRLTHLLWHEGPQGEDYFHLGAGYFLSAPPNDRVRFRSVPEIFVGEFVVPAGAPIGTSGQPVPSVANGTPFFVDTGTVGSDLTQTIGLESLWVRGPLS